MAVEVVMPKFGLTMQEGTIQHWFKAEGDPIAKGESLFEVETEKVLYEVEAPVAGRVAKLLYPEEATVACARVVAVLAVGDEDPAAVAARYAAVPATATAAAVAAPPPVRSPAPGGPGAPVTPAARKLAKEHGIDLTAVAGTGPGGRVTREDVEAAIAAAATAAPAGEPLRGMRKAIAEHMLHSVQSTAQLTITTEADVTELVVRHHRLRGEFAVTITDLVIEAVAAALRVHPRLNATASVDAVRHHAAIDVGVAVAVDDGLIVPVIRGADGKALRDLAVE